MDDPVVFTLTVTKAHAVNTEVDYSVTLNPTKAELVALALEMAAAELRNLASLRS